MFKNLTSDKTLKNVLMLILVVAVIYIVYQIYNNYMKKEGFESGNNQDDDEPKSIENMENQDNESQMMEGQQMMPPQQMMEGQDQSEMMSNPVDRDMRNAQMMGVAGDQLTAQDLLPQDKSSTWAQVNPEGQGSLANQNFLQAGYHIGINTVGQTLRNANLQLRSEPPCPQVQVSPWGQTTIEPDVSRRPMEIGGCA